MENTKINLDVKKYFQLKASALLVGSNEWNEYNALKVKLTPYFLSVSN